MLKIEDLLIGLANTSPNYGLLKSNLLTADTLNSLWRLGFMVVDSSESYWNAENILSQSGQKWKIQNKITLPESNIDFGKITDKLRLMNKGGNIQSLLVHTPDLYLYKNIDKILYRLKELTFDANIPKFGISIYRPNELENLESLDYVDLIQFPHNPMDTSCADWCFENMNRSGKILQARSIFLQGLLVSQKIEGGKYPKNLSRDLLEWHSWLKSKNLLSWEFCVDFVFQDPRIDQVVLGIESAQQAIDITTRMVLTQKKLKYPFAINQKLTDPRRWND